ncbi:MAG: haloacid dehalogenase-like hydrolase [Myxococcales bacterium]|nr:haloacid dehalogenase-like hydrolase [Myxococcales bacterium]
MVLDRLLLRAQREPRSLVVFDLDSTLFSTQERNLAILHEFATAAARPDGLAAAIARLTLADMGWNVMNDLRARGFHDEPTLAELRRYWAARFFTNDYLAHDEPLPGAVDYVRAVHGVGAGVVYLTGRDEPGMGRGTRASLEQHRFPLGGDSARLYLKPRFEEDDLEFKRRVSQELATLGTVVGAFENEPANANFFCREFPDAEVVLLETVHSPNPPPLDARVFRRKDFVR